MAGERRTKGAENEVPRGTVRTLTRGHERKGGEGVIPLPPRRKRSGPSRRRPAKKVVGHGRLRLIVGAVAVVCLSLGARAAQLSVADDNRYQAFAEQRAPAAAEDQPGRGPIVSADGRRLATSLDAAKVIATPYQVEDPEAVAKALYETLGSEAGSADEIKAKLAQKNDEGALSGYSVVVSGIEPEKAREVQALGLPGVSVAPDAVRVYQNGPLASQLMGHLGTDKAYGGVEARYDEVLKSGQEVDLTLDTAVQQELEDALTKAAKEQDAKGALGLVMRIKDGAIVALANAPGYDNNHFEKASAEAQRDRILTDPYEPGSTFKPFTVAAALEEGAVTKDSTFVVPDSIAVADRVIHDSEDHLTETLNPTGILQHSRNVGTIQIAQRLGGERLSEHLRSFGFGEGTGVDLWGDDAGRVPPYEEWSGTSIGNIPIGQGLTVTPMQLAAGYAALANGGLRVTPYVARTAAPGGPGQRVISEKTSSIVRGMLQSVVDEGTGHLAQIPRYTVAGKTGTAQKVDPETGLYGDEYVTSFIGFAPAENPEYLALVIVDEPQGEIWGEVTSAPVFQKVMSFTLGYFDVAPDRRGPDPASAPTAQGGTP
jgi:cell division protein FtsI (penicillin-binding protein 3)